MEYVELKIEVSDNKVLRVQLDGKNVKLSKLKATIRVPKRAEDYILTWFVKDIPKATYEVKVTSPESVKMEHKGTIDNSQKDFGMYWFSIKPDPNT